MNKKTTKKPTISRAKVGTKSRTVSKSKLASAKKPRKTVVTAKKTTVRKGIKHHAKRIYRLTPKFVHGMIAGAFVGVVVVTSLGYTGNSYADADPCIKAAQYANGEAITFTGDNGNKKAEARMRLQAGCGKRTLVMKSFYAQSKSGDPHDTQVRYAVSEQKIFTDASQKCINDASKCDTISVPIFSPSCYYQVDIVEVTATTHHVAISRTGGNHDCTPSTPPPAPTPTPTPTPSLAHSCDSFGLTPGDNRTVSISTFSYTAKNVLYDHTNVNWGDNKSQDDAIVKGLSHQYAADGKYIVTATVYFTYKDAAGQPQTVNDVCTAKISFNNVPNSIYVCQISTKLLLNIDEKLYGSSTYPPDQYTKDLSKCVTTTAPPAKLANTGPGAVLTIFGLAILGGYAFHMRHRHVQHKKHQHHAK